jgi:predicted ester cyclase
MSVEQNKECTRQTIEEVMNKGNIALIPELFSPNYVHHFPGGQDIKGHDGWRLTVNAAHAAFPDVHYTIDELVAEGEKVVCHYTMTGTQKGEYSGIPPTGKRATTSGIFINRFKDGKVVETWAPNALLWYQQLGVTPPAFKQAEEKNKEIIRRTMDEVWSKGNLSLIPELFTSDYTSYNSSGKTVLGHDGFRKLVESARIGYPDLLCTIDQLVAEGDNIVCRYTITGTHKGEYLGIAPTGKKISVLCLFLTIIRDGKSAETWALNDSLASFKQLGIAPPGYEIKQVQPAVT